MAGLEALEYLRPAHSQSFLEVHATRAGDLEGIFELALIVRSLSGGAVQGKLTLDVLVEQPRRMGPGRSAEVKGASSLLVGYSEAEGGIFFEPA